MDNGPEIDKPWLALGELVLWAICFCWAVLLFNAFLPPTPEETPLESYLGRQFQRQAGGHFSAQPPSSEGEEPTQQMGTGRNRE